MRFDRIGQFNRIVGHLSGGDYFKVDFIPFDHRIHHEFSIRAGGGKLVLGDLKDQFRRVLLGYLLNHYSIGLSRSTNSVGYQFFPDTDIEWLVAETCREFSEPDILQILGGNHEFFLQQPISGKHITAGKFRNQTDILVHSFFYRQRKSIQDLFRFLSSQERLMMYKSVLSLSLLGYLTIHEHPVEEIQMTKIEPTPSEKNSGTLPGQVNKTSVNPKVNALQRLLSKIAGI